MLLSAAALGRAASRACASAAAAGALSLDLRRALVAGRLHELAECLHSLHDCLEFQQKFVNVGCPSAVVVFGPCEQGDAG